MKIYDCFPFNGELKLLKLRLDLYKNIVDFHVIVESNVDFRGRPKTLLMPNEILDKHTNLRYIVLKNEDFKINDPWHREYKTRNSLARGLYDAKAEDIILISDIDEIVAPNKIERSSSKIFLYELTWHLFFYDYLAFNVTWKHPCSFPFKILKKYSINDMRILVQSIRKRKVKEKYFEVRSAGSHFSYLPKNYDSDENFFNILYNSIKNKISSFPENWVPSKYRKFEISKETFFLLYFFGVDFLGTNHLWGKCKNPLIHFEKKDQDIIIRNIATPKTNTFLSFKSSLLPFSFMKRTEKFFWRFTHRTIMIYNYFLRNLIIPLIIIFFRFFKIKII